MQKLYSKQCRERENNDAASLAGKSGIKKKKERNPPAMEGKEESSPHTKTLFKHPAIAL